MEKILRAKLKSSKAFRVELLATGNKILIEARHDVWWGSGMSFKMSTTTKHEYHPGQSWLVEILMKIRSQIQSENDNELEISEVPETSAVSQVDHHRSSSPRQSRPLARRGRPASTSTGLKGRSPNSSDLKIRTASNSPARISSLKSVKFDTPLLKDFLRRKVKETISQTASSNLTNNLFQSDSTHISM